MIVQRDEKLFNWSEVHSERSDFLQNPYFKQLEPSNYELKLPEKCRHNVIIDESRQGDGEI